MLINMRNAMMAGGGKLSAKSYIQDGLIAMWDGIENAGWGQHDMDAITWKDLSGNGNNLTVHSLCTFEGDCLRTWSRRSGDCYALASSALDCITAEFVCERVEMGGLVSFFGAGNGKMFTLESEYAEFLNPYKEVLDVSMPAKAAFSCVYGTGTSVNVKCNGRQMTRGSGSNNWSYASKKMNFGLGGGSIYWQYQMLGRIFCVRLYTRALTAAEVAANWAVDKVRFNLTDAT